MCRIFLSKVSDYLWYLHVHTGPYINLILTCTFNFTMNLGETCHVKIYKNGLFSFKIVCENNLESL